MEKETLAQLIAHEIAAQGNELAYRDNESIVLIAWATMPVINVVRLAEKILAADQAADQAADALARLVSVRKG